MIRSPLTSGVRLARSAVWNVLGQGLPLLAALVAIPALLGGLGIDRFGVLTLAWVLIGYFGLFDLGLSWALTRLVSERLARDRVDEVPPLVWTALAGAALFGLVGALVLAAAAPWIAHAAMRVPAGMRGETATAIGVLALSLPFVTVNGVLIGVLGALQRFDLVSALRVAMGVGFSLAPLATLAFAPSLPPAFAALVLVRVLGTAGALTACLRVVPGLAGRRAVEWGLLGTLLRFGGWMTVSSAVSPLLTYLDRFAVGAMLSMAAVAYYATPYEVTTRLLLLSTPVAGVLFPAFAASHVTDVARARQLFDWGVRVVFLGLFPCTLLAAALAPEGLARWISPEMAANGAPVMRWLAAGVLINGVAQVALALVQSCGRPSWSARLHLAEVPFYVLLLVTLIRHRGIEGAAMAWTARAGIDALALFAMSDRLLGGERGGSLRHALPVALGLAAVALASTQPGLGTRLAIAAAGLAVVLACGWRLLGRRLRSVIAPGPSG
jgi:O-antigen/teichoic acid export membrane protein